MLSTKEMLETLAKESAPEEGAVFVAHCKSEDVPAPAMAFTNEIQQHWNHEVSFKSWDSHRRSRACS